MTARSGGRTERGPLTFVVHKHAASRLHYDFRLEAAGVLKSWAIPKGPSLNPADKRLAVLVDDHALEYGAFEGVLPEGGYGAGQVIVWDRGRYAPLEEGAPVEERDRAEALVRRALRAGRLRFVLYGEKLTGAWMLLRFRRGPNNWLLVKEADAAADRSSDVTRDERSVVSGRKIEDLREGGAGAA